MIVPVPPPMVDAVWPQVEHLLLPALGFNQGELAPEDILQFLRDNQMWLLTIHQSDKIVAAAVLELVQYPRKRSLRIVLLGGSGLQDWMGELQVATNDMAKSMGASFVELHGRPGWERALRKLDRVHPKAIVMIMEVV